MLAILILIPPAVCILSLFLSFLWVQLCWFDSYLFVSQRFLMFKSNMFLASGRDHPSLREIMQSYLSLIATELFKHASSLPMCLYLCIFFVFISITACLHWCWITEEIKVDIEPPLPPHTPPRFPLLSLCLALCCFLYICVFPWSCCGIVSLCVD